ncbi:MAG: hypothetical protein Q8L99_09090 [Polycyclovorans sp.]|jgi:hypothetical protein|nr:hypothetical protein [Polycyclovorans sp.]MBU0790019.1 hypothetical protein [Gammaproteobacteria bacterium]MDP1543290.1 hypothetical protein [Polycyclovorans sp.]|tara:strand:+ start:69122 stop:69457 length:336 start_codon:yes stop_codon:yes gene_type:complete
MKKVTLLIPCLLAGLWMGSAAAADPHGKLTDEQRARIEARCAENPERCEKVKDRLTEAKARCDANPAACEARKDEMKARAEARREACAADPAACAEQRDAVRERVKQYQNP